jgi:hypothetical protein
LVADLRAVDVCACCGDRSVTENAGTL